MDLSTAGMHGSPRPRVWGWVEGNRSQMGKEGGCVSRLRPRSDVHGKRLNVTIFSPWIFSWREACRVALQETSGRDRMVHKTLEAPARCWVRWPPFLPLHTTVTHSRAQDTHRRAPLTADPSWHEMRTAGSAGRPASGTTTLRKSVRVRKPIPRSQFSKETRVCGPHSLFVARAMRVIPWIAASRSDSASTWGLATTPVDILKKG